MNRTGSFLILLLLFVVAAFPSATQAQTRPPKTMTSLDSMAHAVSQQLQSKKLRVVVLDFGAPNLRWTAFGAYLADQFSAALAKDPGTLSVIDRAQLPAALNSMSLQPEQELNYSRDKKLAAKIGVQCLIRGSYGEFKGDLGITLSVSCPKASRITPPPLVGRLNVSPEMAQRLEVPLDSLRPADLIPNAGEGGVTYPACVSCPEAPFTNEAGIAKYGGTVKLTVVVTPEGQVVDIKVTQGLKYGLEESAVNTVSHWRLTPAHDPDGNPAAVRQTIEVTFNP